VFVHANIVGGTVRLAAYAVFPIGVSKIGAMRFTAYAMLVACMVYALQFLATHDACALVRAGPGVARRNKSGRPREGISEAVKQRQCRRIDVEQFVAERIRHLVAFPFRPYCERRIQVVIDAGAEFFAHLAFRSVIA
jgi:hypothetical protein